MQLTPSYLQSNHHLPLHLFHAFLTLLIILFLLLGGITGPQTSFWWLQVEYTGQGGTWNLGGLGGCESGSVCKAGQAVPPHGKSIQATLIWHFPATILFTILAAITNYLIFRPPLGSLDVHWWTLFLPPLTTFIPLITFITDIAIRQTISAANDVKSVHTQGSFWLSLLALITSILWAGIMEHVRLLQLRKRDRALKEEKQQRRREREEEKARQGGWNPLTALWKAVSPWRDR